MMKPNLEFQFDEEKASRQAGTMGVCERCSRKTGIYHKRDLSNKIVKEWGSCGFCNTSWVRFREIFTDNPHKQTVKMIDKSGN